MALSIYLMACLQTLAYAANDGSEMVSESAVDTLYFDIPPQTLESALTVFSKTAGYSLLVGGDLIQGRISDGVRGEWPPHLALQKLLRASGLAVRYVGRNAFTLVPTPSGNNLAAEEEFMPVVPEQAAVPGEGNFSYLLQAAVTRILCAVQPDSFGRYRLGMQLHMTRGGRISDVHLLESSGSVVRDRQVWQSLQGMDVGVAVPAGMPQLITILLTPRSDPVSDCRYFSDEAK